MNDQKAKMAETEERRGPGKPQFVPTADQREQIAVCAGSGKMSHEEMAIALGICRNTLELHFEAELTVGAYQHRMEVIEALYAAAKKGNVGAIREYTSVTPEVACPPDVKAEDAAEAAPVGVKAERNEAAKNAQSGTDWEGILPKHPAAGNAVVPPKLAIVARR